MIDKGFRASFSKWIPFSQMLPFGTGSSSVLRWFTITCFLSSRWDWRGFWFIGNGRPFGPAKRSTTRPHGSGQKSSVSTLPSVLLRAFRWNFSSEPIGPVFRYAGGVIGQTLAMEGMFAFFLESAFVGALIWGEKRLGPRDHFLAAVAVALGSWTSGYFILVTNAFMQHPAGYGITPDGSLEHR